MIMQMKKYRNLLLVLLMLPMVMVAQNDDTQVATDSVDRMAPDFVHVSICVVDPTDWRDDMLGVLGHAFMRLQCPHFDLDYCYSYEGQSANDNILGFLTGNLKMGLFAEPTEEYIKPFARWNRTVREYHLNMPPEAETRLWQIMDEHLADGNQLPLDLAKHGCTQTLVQFVTQALDTTAIEYGEWPDEFAMSRYDIIEKELKPYPWLRLMAKCMGMYGNFAQDCSNDEKIILPRQIEEVWQKARVNGNTFMVYKGDLVKGESPVVELTWFTPGIAGGVLILIVAAGMLVIYRKKGRRQK